MPIASCIRRGISTFNDWRLAALYKKHTNKRETCLEATCKDALRPSGALVAVHMHAATGQSVYSPAGCTGRCNPVWSRPKLAAQGTQSRRVGSEAPAMPRAQARLRIPSLEKTRRHPEFKHRMSGACNMWRSDLLGVHDLCGRHRAGCAQQAKICVSARHPKICRHAFTQTMHQ